MTTKGWIGLLITLLCYLQSSIYVFGFIYTGNNQGFGFPIAVFIVLSIAMTAVLFGEDSFWKRNN